MKELLYLTVIVAVVLLYLNLRGSITSATQSITGLASHTSGAEDAAQQSLSNFFYNWNSGANLKATDQGLQVTPISAASSITDADLFGGGF